MIVIRIIEVAVTINDPIGFASDTDSLKAILSAKYKDICYANCFILEILEIIRMGNLMINQDGGSTSSSLSVRFRARALVYNLDEVINGCKVITRDQNHITCQSDNTMCTLAAAPENVSIKLGQIISVRAVISDYTIGAQYISVRGVMFLPSTDEKIYKLGDLSSAGRAKLADVLNRITYEENIVKTMVDNTSWKTFKTYLHAYKTAQEPGKGITICDLFDLVKSTKGIKYISRSPKLQLSTPKVYSYSAESDFPKDAQVIYDLAPEYVMMAVLEDYCDHLRNIREMTEIYSTEDILKSHMNLWMVFARARK